MRFGLESCGYKTFLLFYFICSHSKHTFLGNFSVKALKVGGDEDIIKDVGRTEHCPLIMLRVPVGNTKGQPWKQEVSIHRQCLITINLLLVYSR